MKRGLVAAVLFLGAATLFVSDGLFTPRVGLSMDGLYTVEPWARNGAASLESRNPSLDYQAFFTYPWYRYTLEHWRRGTIPLWTHLVGGGTPFMGNLSSAVFHPLTLLGLLVPEGIYFSLAALLKIWTAAFFTYLLLRRYGLRFLSAFLGGLSFGFGGFMVCWLNHPHTTVMCTLPALLLAVEWFLSRRTGLSLAANALLLALQSLGGSPEASFLLFLCWAFYLLYRLRHETALFSFKGFKLAAFGLLAGFLGFLLAAFQLWPFFEYLFHSYGLELRIQEWPDYLNGGPGRLFTPFGFFLGLLFPLLTGAAIVLLQRKNTFFVGFWSGVLGGLCLIVALRIGFWLGAKPHLLMQVLPELYGNAAGGCRTSGEISFSALNGGYAGVIPAFLALYTFVAPCKRRPLPFFVFLFVLSFGASHSIPWLVHMVKSVPYLGWIHNSCLLSLTAFSTAVLAPFGLEDLMFRAANIRGRTAAVGGVAGAFIVVGLAVLVSGWSFFETGKDLVPPKRNPARRVVITTPVNGSILDSRIPLQLEGRTRSDVDYVAARMDRIPLGRKRTEPPRATGEGGTGGTSRFDRSYFFTYDLENVDEGTYRVVVEPLPSVGGAVDKATGESTDIRVVRAKAVTRKDFTVLLLSALVFLLLLGRSIPVKVRAVVAVLMVGADLCAFGLGYNRTCAREEIFPPSKVTDFLAARKGPYRIFTEGGILPPNTNFPAHIEHMEWDDRLGVAGYCKVCNHIKLDYLAKPRNFNVLNFNLEHPLFDFLGVRFLLVKSPFDLARHMPEKFDLVFRDGPIRIYENRLARSRVFVSGDWIVLGEERIDEVLKADLRRRPVLDKTPPIRRGGKGTARLATYEDTYVRVETDTRGPTLLILTDNYFPGWEAFVDGRPAQILKTTGSFRAVPLPEDGHHIVEFRYRPRAFTLGLVAAGLALLACILLAVFPNLTLSLRPRGRGEWEEVDLSFLKESG